MTGLLDRGGVLDRGVLRYTCGRDSEGDAVLEAVLGWRPPRGWVVQLTMRRVVTERHAPRDDLLLMAPGVEQPFRSCKQALRAAAGAER